MSIDEPRSRSHPLPTKFSHEAARHKNNPYQACQVPFSPTRLLRSPKKEGSEEDGIDSLKVCVSPSRGLAKLTSITVDEVANKEIASNSDSGVIMVKETLSPHTIEEPKKKI